MHLQAVLDRVVRVEGREVRVGKGVRAGPGIDLVPRTQTALAGV